jgi:tight adherence protein B
MQTALAAKRLEQSVMNIMPFAIVLYLNFSNPGYFDMLFHNVSGVLIMTGCLCAYLIAFTWAEHIFMKLYE